MMRPSLQVIIFQDSRGELPSLACGVPCFLPQDIELVAHQLKERYGEEVEVEMVDLAQSPRPEILELVKSLDLLLPLVTVDGALRLSGSFDLRMMVEVIDAQREASPWLRNTR